MSKITIDTDKVKDIIDLLNSNIVDYEANVENLFNNIKDINSSWSGVDADAFVNGVFNEKKVYDTIGVIMSQYTTQLKDIVYSIEEKI